MAHGVQLLKLFNQIKTHLMQICVSDSILRSNTHLITYTECTNRAK